LITERIKELEAICKKRAIESAPTHFAFDYNSSALGQFAELPHAEKLARAMAYAIENQDVFAYPDDRIGGRIYYSKESPVQKACRELDCMANARAEFLELYPEAEELWKYQLIGGTAKGHITWFFDRILTHGTEQFKQKFTNALKHAKDEEAKEFYEGVIIMIDALQAFNDKHIAVYESMGNHELAERMKRVPRYPAKSFRDAVQAFFMQHIVVMRENPFGGNGPGRLDYYLWPYLERDLKAGLCTLDEAKEIIDELFLRIDERIHRSDKWVEAIVVGGTYPNGASAVNPLTYIMIQSIIDLNITHPSIYVRIPENPPEDLLDLCAEFMISGNNRAQILYDPAVIDALVKNGHPYRDAVEYACGGCMEVGIQGMTSDFLFIGKQNAAKMLELMITGGVCLLSGARVNAFKANKGLGAYSSFEDFYTDFIAEAKRLTTIYLEQQDVYSKWAERNRPSYLISSMIDDCLSRGRNMHAGGAKYHDYGGAHLGLPNVADGLYAIKRAIFDEKICTADELITAIKADFKGYEALQAKLKHIPKYGMDNDEADALAGRVMTDFADMYLSYRTRWDGTGKPVILTFVWAPECAKVLGATADGRNEHYMIAHGVSPACSSMKCGITAAINSCGKMPFEKFSGGASTMWDFDASIASEAIVKAVLKTFMEKGGQIFQGNTTPLEELMDAKLHPENYEHLMVRVGGYSARFTHLDAALQEEIINRLRHRV
jgi:formate C-acetyltransferase